MGSLSDYAEQKIIDHLLGVTSYTQLTNLYVALAASNVTDADTGATFDEVPNANNYARVNFNDWTAAASRSLSNNSIIQFNQATGGNWGTVTDIVVLDSATHGAGNIIAYDAMPSSQTINEDDQPSFAAGAVVIAFAANGVSDYAADSLLDHLFINTAFTSPANTYIALSDADPIGTTTGSTISEPGDTYARVLFNDWNAASGDPTAIDNASEIAFAEATASWGTIIAFAVCDSSTLGEILVYGGMNIDKLVTAGHTAKFAAGDLNIQID